MTDDRLDRILDAAYRSFTRHGVRRTTMDDIAAEAGMSRPAVYQYVRSKDDAFRRLAQRLFDTALADARAAAEAGGSFDDRLARVLAVKLDLTLRLWRDSPHAAELLTVNARLCGDLATAYTDAMVGLVATVVSDAAVREEIDLTSTDAAIVADIAVALTRGLEADTTNPERPPRQLRHAVALIARGLRSTS